MLTFLAVALAGSMLGAADLGVSGPVRVARDTIAADSIIARYLTAIGGRDRLRADTTRRMAGTYQEGDFHATTTMLWARPSFRRVSVTGPDGFTYVELFDGEREYEYSESFARATQRDTGAAERAGRRGAEFDDSFVDYATKGHRVESRGVTTIGGRALYHLHVTLADGWEKEYYFDPATGLLVALRKAMPLHARGPAVESLTYYSDYRPVSGVLRPFTEEERKTRTGALMTTLHWTSIESNVPVRAEAFRPPSSCAYRSSADGP